MQYSFMIVFYDCISWCQLFFLLFHFLFCLFGWWSPPYQEVGPDLRGWGRSLRKLGFFLAWWQFLSWLGACPQLWGLDLYLWSGSGSLPCSEIKLHFWSLCPNRCRALAWSGSVPFLAYSCTGWQCSPNWLASLLPQGVCVCVCVYKPKKISVLARGLSAGAGEAGTGTCCALTCMLEWSWQSIQSTRKFSICCLCAGTGSMHSSRAES